MNALARMDFMKRFFLFSFYELFQQDQPIDRLIGICFRKKIPQPRDLNPYQSRTMTETFVSTKITTLVGGGFEMGIFPMFLATISKHAHVSMDIENRETHREQEYERKRIIAKMLRAQLG